MRRTPVEFREVTSSGLLSEHPIVSVSLEKAVQRYVNLGLHTELGKTEAEYRGDFNRLPQLTGQSILVDPRVALERQIELAVADIGIRCVYDRRIPVADMGVGPVDQPYIYSLIPPALRDGKTLAQALEADHRAGLTMLTGLTGKELLALLLQWPNFFNRGHGLVAACSMVGTNMRLVATPYRNSLGLDAIPLDSRDPSYWIGYRNIPLL